MGWPTSSTSASSPTRCASAAAHWHACWHAWGTWLCSSSSIPNTAGPLSLAAVLPPQGVLLPALGTFVVGQALEDRFSTYKRWRATFSLLDGRFGGVSQERSKFRLLSESPCRNAAACGNTASQRSRNTGKTRHWQHAHTQRLAQHTQLGADACLFAVLLHADRAAVTQLNYQLIAQDAQVHRSIAQRLITEMLQRLAMHIVAGHAVQVGRPARCREPNTGR